MNIDAMIASPEEHFTTVSNLVASDKLTRSEKIKALKNWKATSEHMQESEAEGMEANAPKDDQLSDVVDALSELESSQKSA